MNLHVDRRSDRSVQRKALGCRPGSSITSSARAISSGDRSRPSARAVLRLMARSNFVDGLTLDVAEFAQRLPKALPPRRVIEDADTRNFRALLGARADRPCRHAAEQLDELAAPHSRTSLARATNTSDKEMPSNAAVLRLTAM